MTYKEAIEVIKEINDVLQNPFCQSWSKDREAIKLSVEALEKQIPLPPFNKEFPNGAITHYCPRCHEELELHPNFCDNCGQAIDWSD